MEHIYIYLIICIYIYICFRDRLLLLRAYFKSELIYVSTYLQTCILFVFKYPHVYLYYTYVCHPHAFLAHLHILIPPSQFHLGQASERGAGLCRGRPQFLKGQT